MSNSRTDRIEKTLKNVQMDILGAIRTIPEVKVSYTKNRDGSYSRCISLGEYNRIADEIHRQLRAQRRVYSERD